MERNIDIMNLTPEKLAEMQQAERDRIAAEEAAKAKAEEVAQRKRDAEIAARRKMFAKPANAIVAALKTRAPDRTFEARLPDNTYGEASVVEVRKDQRASRLPYIDIVSEMSGSTWHRYENGKTRVSVGEHGNRTRFPQRKDGTHSYDKIADLAVTLMLEREKREKIEKDMSKVRAYNVSCIEALRTDLGLSEYYGTMRLEASADAEKPAMVKVNIQRAMTPSEVTALHNALVALGLVDKKKGA